MLRLSSVITIVAAAVLSVCIQASVHEFDGEKFVAKGNTFVVHGGSEGIYSSAPGLNESSPGDSFTRDLSGKARLFFVLPVAILDAFFILWILTSLSSTLNKLQLYFKSNDVYNEQWQNAWIIPAFWQVLSFSLLCIICALWAPSQNSMRYAYSSEDAGEEFDKDDTLTLIKPFPLASKNVSSPELRFAKSGNDLSYGNFEEEKTA